MNCKLHIGARQRRQRGPELCLRAASNTGALRQGGRDLGARPGGGSHRRARRRRRRRGAAAAALPPGRPPRARPVGLRCYRRRPCRRGGGARGCPPGAAPPRSAAPPPRRTLHQTRTVRLGRPRGGGPLRIRRRRVWDPCRCPARRAAAQRNFDRQFDRPSCSEAHCEICGREKGALLLL